jgi:hypothetical protein
MQFLSPPSGHASGMSISQQAPTAQCHERHRPAAMQRANHPARGVRSRARSTVISWRVFRQRLSRNGARSRKTRRHTYSEGLAALSENRRAGHDHVAIVLDCAGNGLPRLTSKAAARANSAGRCAARHVRIQRPDRFAGTRATAGNRPSQRTRRCFSLDSTFIDLSAKVDSLPLLGRHPAHRPHCYPQRAPADIARNVSLNVCPISGWLSRT